MEEPVLPVRPGCTGKPIFGLFIRSQRLYHPEHSIVDRLWSKCDSCNRCSGIVAEENQRPGLYLYGHYHSSGDVFPVHRKISDRDGTHISTAPGLSGYKTCLEHHEIVLLSLF